MECFKVEEAAVWRSSSGCCRGRGCVRTACAVGNDRQKADVRERVLVAVMVDGVEGVQVVVSLTNRQAEQPRAAARTSEHNAHHRA